MSDLQLQNKIDLLIKLDNAIDNLIVDVSIDISKDAEEYSERTLTSMEEIRLLFLSVLGDNKQ